MTRAHRFVQCAAVLIVMAGLTVGAQQTQPPPGPPPSPGSPAPTGDEHAALPAGEGRDLMIRVCSPCHVPEKVADQQLDPAGWKKLVDQMAGQGATATDEEFDQIVRYLATAFPISPPEKK